MRNAGAAGLKIELEEVLREYGPMIARIASSYERNPEARNDLLQEAAIAIWRALPAFRGDGPLKAFVARIVRNRCITHVARAARGPRAAEIDGGLTSRERTPEEALDQNQQRERLLHSIRAMPLPQREVVVLALEGFSQGEIADALGISENAVTLRYMRAKQRLKEELSS